MAGSDLSDEQPGGPNTVVLEATEVLSDLADALEPFAADCLDTALASVADSLARGCCSGGDCQPGRCCHDAVRQLDDGRERVIERFRGALAGVFQAGDVASSAPNGCYDGPGEGVSDGEQATLEAAVTHLQDQYSRTLSELEQRLGHVLALDARAISPCDPAGMMRAAAVALRASAIRAATRTQVYERLEAQLGATLDGVYAVLNAELRAAGLSANDADKSAGAASSRLDARAE